MVNFKKCAVILAGGSGYRLWPVSRELLPKQFLSLIGSSSLIQETIKRISPIVDSFKIICGKKHFFETDKHLRDINIPNVVDNIITEPCSKNTAAAILLAALSVPKNTVLIILPSDHFIKEIDSFRKKVEKAIDLAILGNIITFGIKPQYPETGYGYIKCARDLGNSVLTIDKFIEKPCKDKAIEFLESKDFFWNSGMFVSKVSTVINLFEKFQPYFLKKMREFITKGSENIYKNLPNISFDEAIMEKTRQGLLIPSDFGWSDIGSWKSLYNFLPKDNNHNVVEGDVILRNSKNSFIKGNKRLVVINNVKDIVVVETPDAVFVSDLDKSKDVREIVNLLKNNDRYEYKSHVTTNRPWGKYTILEEGKHTKIKRLVVNPGASLSYQMHLHRSEHWVVVQGTARIRNKDKTFYLTENQSTYIPKTVKHRLENPSNRVPLHLIEVQIGCFLKEEDIIRYSDT